MPDFFGLCGRSTPTPCRLIWNSTYPTKVGTYPSAFLPSSRTIWHFSADGRYTFRPPAELLSTLPLLGGVGLVGLGFFNLIPTAETFTPQSHFIIIFAKTINRLNIPHVITQAEIDSMDSGGIARINLGEYVAEVVAATDQIKVIELGLTKAELLEIKNSNESVTDRSFRKIFQQNIPDNMNRMKGIELNKLGVEYRLDNGSFEANSAMTLAGMGDLTNPSYRDGSSRIILVDLKKITERVTLTAGAAKPIAGSLQAEAREPKAGDTIYLTYVAIQEHYLRQSIEVSWSIFATPTPAPACFSFPSKVKVAHYRFFEWETDSEPSLKLHGWRVTETFNIPVNYVAPMSLSGSTVLGDFIIGGATGITSLNYMPTNINEEQLRSFITKQTPLPGYSVNLNVAAGGTNYHINTGANRNRSNYLQAPWYSRLQNKYTNGNEASEHVLFNVHPQALKKRDVDKYGIERFMAVEIEKDIKSAIPTFFPFMDDPTVNEPGGIAGSSTYLSGNNTLFKPVKPLARYSLSNAEIECGVGGAVQLGFTGSGQDNIFAVFTMTGNIMNEKFDKDTRAVIERHFTVGQRGLRFAALQGALRGPSTAISCTKDPSGAFAFAVHVNNDGFLVFNSFKNGFLQQCLQKLEYRPDLPAPLVINNDNPTIGQFTEFVGYSGMLGDRPGHSPGLMISLGSFAAKSSFRYKTTSKDWLKARVKDLANDQIEEISLKPPPEEPTAPAEPSFDEEEEVVADKRVMIPVGPGYYGRVEMEYELKFAAPKPFMFIFRLGNNIASVIDSVYIIPTERTSGTFALDCKWIRADVIEIVGPITNFSITNVSVQQVEDDVAVDFLDAAASSSSDNANPIINGEFYNGKIFVKTDVVSVSEDNHSCLYVFFNDLDGGISCFVSNDLGRTWYFYYGIVEPMQGQQARNPFVVTSFETNKCFLFYTMNGKIMCKNISYNMFDYNDAFIIERFAQDRLVAADTTGEDEEQKQSLPREKIGLFTERGRSLRRNISNVAAGDVGNKDFLLLLGEDVNSGTDQSKETRIVETEAGSETTDVRINPIVIGSNTAFLHQDIADIFFSAYRTDNGEMRLFFLAKADESIGGGMQLQCNFSVDNGISWYDQWEFIDHSYDRLRTDSATHTNFINRTASGIEDIFGEDPLLEDELAKVGINVHWSRLFRHKKEGKKDIKAESNVLKIEAPYAFYQPTSHKVFLFYIYNGCLLCKMFDDEILKQSAASERDFTNNPPKDSATDEVKNPEKGIKQLKQILEVNTRAFFVDGDLSDPLLREEIHYYVNTELQERMIEGNIIFTHQIGIKQFNADRAISPQRVCAYDLPNGNVRVFYKTDKDNNLHAALWTGSQWYVEELMVGQINGDGDVNIPMVLPERSFAARDVVGAFSVDEEGALA